jgi:hypothetical protein
MTKIAIICDPGKFSAKIQALGERINGRPVHPAMPYHCAWVTDDAIYDMNWTFRKLPRDYYEGSKKIVKLFDSPIKIPAEYFERMVGKRTYGTVDVALNPILTPLGINWFGTHCAEAINDDLWFNK